MVTNQDFHLLQEATIDANGSLHLGPTATACRYRILVNGSGQLLLDPINDRELDDREQWLWENPQAISLVQTGIAQAAQGQTLSLGSFAQYANLDIDDE